METPFLIDAIPPPTLPCGNEDWEDQQEHWARERPGAKDGGDRSDLPTLSVLIFKKQ